MPHDERDHAERHEPHRHELRDGNAEERPVVHAQRLEQEAHEAVPDEEDGHEVTGSQPIAVAAGDPEQRDRPEDSREGFVQEQGLEMGVGRCRPDQPGDGRGDVRAFVACDAMGTVDRDAPRQLRRRAVQLLVEEVAPAGDALHREHGRRSDVGPRPELEVLVAGVEIEGDDPGDQPAVGAEARVGRQDDPEWIVLVEGPLVDDVVQAAADQRRAGHDDHPVGDHGLRQPAPASLRNDDPVAHRETDRVADAVPVDRDGAELEQEWARGEVDHRVRV